MRPIITIRPGVGLRLENNPGSETFQPLRVGHGDLHLQWQPVYQDVLRSVGPFAAFFPQAIFEGNGDVVTFSHCEEGRDILSQTRPLESGEAIPGDEWERLDSGFRQFKAIANRDGVPSDVRRFIEEFAYPSHVRFPEAFRIYKPHWYSRRRLFILWGLEPLGGASFVRPTPSEARSELAGRVETTKSKANWWLGRVLLAMLALALIGTAVWWIMYALLPSPRAGFAVPSPMEGQVVTCRNKTTYDVPLFEFGDVSYIWNFEKGQPPSSSEEAPSVSWDKAGERGVTLTAKRQTWFGISKSSTAGPVVISVQPLPPPAPVPDNKDSDAQRASNQQPGNHDSSKHDSKDNDSANHDPGRPGSGNDDSRELVSTKRETDNKNSANGETDRRGSDNKDSGKQGAVNKGTVSQDSNEQGSEKKNSGKQDPLPVPDRIQVGSATIVWYGSRAYGIDQPKFWVDLGIEVPPGFRAVAVTIGGQRREYTGRFEQLVDIGDSAIEIEVAAVGQSGASRSTIAGTIRFRRGAEFVERKGAPADIPRNSPPSGPDHGEGQRVDPKKVPDLSPSTSA